MMGKSMILLCIGFLYIVTVSLSEGTYINEMIDNISGGQNQMQKNSEKCNFNHGNNTEVCRNSIPVPVPCDPKYPYRNIDGTCNNLENPSWCSSLECYQRFLPAYYEGFENYRISVKGGPLPEPRKLSLNINLQKSVPAQSVSMMYPVFGQLVAHDISNAVSPLDPDCCAPENKNNPICAVISVSPTDPYYSRFNVTCLDLKRTNLCQPCESDKRQQENQETSSIDASAVYGPNNETAQFLRTNDGTGRLRTNLTKYGDLLLNNENPNQIFCPIINEKSCFSAGDNRVNQHATLTGLHTLFMREHNRIVKVMKDLNPFWGEEKLYQETRKIVGAEMQCVAYKEFLPLLLGDDAIKHYGLSISKLGEATRYDPSVQCGVWNSYATALGRLHTLVGSNVGVNHLRFEDLLAKPDLIREGYMTSLLEGVCHVPSQKYDRFFVEDMRDHLYVNLDVSFGIDLAATDILRGRDHGLPPYIEILNFCNGGNLSIKRFQDLFPYMERENILLLKKNYKDVRDIDLTTGAMLEKHVPGTDFGPTGICILGTQFHSLKYGDRFYFEHQGEIPSFTPAQREALKQNCSLSRILCDNNEQKKQQRQAMLVPGLKNPIVNCDQLPRIDLSLWKENP